MKQSMQMFGNHAPRPPHATDKTCYQKRVSWGPSTYPSMSFMSTEEGAERALAPNKQMAYTGIHGHAPTEQERGIAPRQSVKGGFDNSK